MPVTASQSTPKSRQLKSAQQSTLSKKPPGAVQDCPKNNHWIEIQLQDDDGEPIPNEEYILVDSVDKEHKGTLDGNGFARIDGLKTGVCRVSFPKLYKKWQPVWSTNTDDS
jgi:hypothetical protein